MNGLSSSAEDVPPRKVKLVRQRVQTCCVSRLQRLVAELVRMAEALQRTISSLNLHSRLRQGAESSLRDRPCR